MEKSSNFITIINDKGLHTRPATELVKCAARFSSLITLHFQGLSVNAKSLLGILMLAAAKGSKIQVDAEGEDGADAIEALVMLAESKFYMEY